MSAKKKSSLRPAWKEKLHEIIFEAETPFGKFFDIGLLLAIVTSVVLVILDSVESVHAEYGKTLLWWEWHFTFLFTIEYFLRLLCVRNRLKYAKSFFGIVDVLAILPTYLSVFIGGAQSLMVIRGLRLLRLFRIFKLARFSMEAEVLMQAIRASRPKITVFVGTVITLVVIMGSVMHLIEGDVNGFPDILIPIQQLFPGNINNSVLLSFLLYYCDLFAIPVI